MHKDELTEDDMFDDELFEDELDVLSFTMKSWRCYSYIELSHLIGCRFSFEYLASRRFPSYGGSVAVDWEREPDGPIRVSGCIHTAGGQPFPPVTECFTVIPDQQAFAMELPKGITIERTREATHATKARARALAVNKRAAVLTKSRKKSTRLKGR
jgi:hypothetical protein